METPIKTSVTPTLSILEQGLQEPKNHREQVVASPHLESKLTEQEGPRTRTRRSSKQPHSKTLMNRSKIQRKRAQKKSNKIGIKGERLRSNSTT